MASRLVAAPSYGLHGGAMFGTASLDSVSAAEGRVGFAAGLNVELGLLNSLKLQPEASYVQRGADFGAGMVQLDYVEFPLLFKLKGGPWAQFPLSIEAGPSLDLNVKSNTVEANRVSWSVLFGASFECFLERDTFLFLSLRYQLGVTPALETLGTRLTTRGLQLLVGLRFDSYSLYPWNPRTDRVDRFKERRGERAARARRKPERRFYRDAAPVVRDEEEEEALPVARRSTPLSDRRKPRRSDELIPDSPFESETSGGGDEGETSGEPEEEP